MFCKQRYGVEKTWSKENKELKKLNLKIWEEIQKMMSKKRFESKKLQRFLILISTFLIKDLAPTVIYLP